MADEYGVSGGEGAYGNGAREDLDAWKRYKQSKALAFVGHGYSVDWCPDADNWMEVYLPERHQSSTPEIRAAVKFYGQPSQYGIDAGMVSKLTITERKTDLVRKLLGQPLERLRVLYHYDRGLEVDHLRSFPAAHRLYGLVLEELN